MSAAIAAAWGHFTEVCKLAEFGGHAKVNRQWAHSLLKCMKFVQRKATTAKSKASKANFAEQKKTLLNNVLATVNMNKILVKLILNWEQTGIKVVPFSTWTMEEYGSKHVEMVGVTDKRQITAVFCGSLTGNFLPVQIVYKGKTPHGHPHFMFPPGWHITHSLRHWSIEQTMVEYV